MAKTNPKAAAPKPAVTRAPLSPLKKVSIVQSPGVPEYPLEPRRLYNSTVFLVLSMLVAGMLNLIVIIIRDHRD